MKVIFSILTVASLLFGGFLLFEGTLAAQPGVPKPQDQQVKPHIAPSGNYSNQFDLWYNFSFSDGGFRISALQQFGKGRQIGLEVGDVILRIGQEYVSSGDNLDQMVQAAIFQNNRSLLVRDINTGQNIFAGF